MSVPAPIGVVAHYNLLERLEPAGPGDLFRARDTRLGRTVTVRLLPSALTPDQASRRSLIARALAVGSLSHPNVTTLFDAGELGDRVYLVFEFLSGQSLRAEMAGRPMNVRRAVELAQDPDRRHQAEVILVCTLGAIAAVGSMFTTVSP